MDYREGIRQLESVLPLIHAVRDSLPSLVSSIARPAGRSPQLDLATVYRSASAQCDHSIAQLAHALLDADPALVQAELSFKTDSSGVVPRDHRDPDPAERIGDLLQSSTTRARASYAPFQPKLEPPHTTAQLDEFIKTWHSHHPRVTLERVSRSGTTNDVERIIMTLKGVMHATIVVKWEQETAMVQLAACSSLKEDISLYRPSRFSLFQDLTNSCMSLIDKSQSRPGDRVSNLEEVLTFLSNPPLPF